MSYFCNGRLLGTTSVPADELMKRFATDFRIGQYGPGNPDTIFDEILILNKPLTADMAGQIYTNGINALAQPITTPLVFTVTPAFNPGTTNLVLTSEIVGACAERSFHPEY